MLLPFPDNPEPDVEVEVTPRLLVLIVLMYSETYL